MHPKFEDSASHVHFVGAVVPEKSYTETNIVTEIFDEKFCWRERKNGQIKGMISMRMLILFYTILHVHVIFNRCTKFQNPRCSSS